MPNSTQHDLKKIICGINQKQNFIFGGSERYLIGLKSVFAEILGIYRTQYAKNSFMQGYIHPMPGKIEPYIRKLK